MQETGCVPVASKLIFRNLVPSPILLLTHQNRSAVYVENLAGNETRVFGA
jgi:hypothetical protein